MFASMEDGRLFSADHKSFLGSYTNDVMPWGEGGV